jgi:hypothetical protein
MSIRSKAALALITALFIGAAWADGIRNVGPASLTNITNSLGADVALNSTSTYFDGPSVAQGTVGNVAGHGLGHPARYGRIGCDQL